MQIRKYVVRNPSLGVIFGLISVGVYLILTIISINYFPGPVSPSTTYLSMLGNADLNPEGETFYNLAVALGGLMLILFYFATYTYISSSGRSWMLRIGVLAGLVNGLSVVMSGIFSEHINLDAHVIWSYLIFFSLIPVLLSFNLTFWTIPSVPIFTSVYGLIVCTIDVFLLVTVLGGGLNAGLGSIMEWVAVFTYLGWVALVSINLLSISPLKPEIEKV